MALGTMGKGTSPHIVGDFWLDKRRDKKSPDIWQIASIKPGTNSITYQSTRERDLDRAKSVLNTFFHNRLNGVNSLRPIEQPDPMRIPVIPQLYRYWDEQGSYAVSASTIEYHLKCFVGFLQQDRAGLGCTFDDVGKHLIERYRLWAMAPNSWSIEWRGKRHNSRSRGICGASFRRSLASVKAALNLAKEDRIVPHVWRIPPLPPELKSPPRTRLLTAEEVGAMIGYATGDEALLNWIRIMLGTGVRPVAGIELLPAKQWDPQIARLDLHPVGARRTNKHNPRVPVIPQLLTLLREHSGPWVPSGVNRQTLSYRWRSMREALGFSSEVVPKTIRHTVATHLRVERVSPEYISILLGHLRPVDWRDYTIVSPDYYDALVPGLSSLWERAHRHANEWVQRYAVVRTTRGRRVVVDRLKYPHVDADTLCQSPLDVVSPRRLRSDRAVPNDQSGSASW
nr:hypothetical protein [uncultured Sphingomonas sp.]